MVDAIEVTRRYFDAWNRHDSDAIVATFAEGGTYSDPNEPEGLTGQAIADYADGLFAAFPDLSFDVLEIAPAGEGTVAAQWTMRGTNTGSLVGSPPTGNAIGLPGADILVVESDKVRSVKGYFDRRTLAEQLGLQVTVSPYSTGAVSFGDSVYLQL